MSENSPPPQVLQLASYWPYLVAVLSDRVARRITRIVKAHGLNLSQWRVLAAVADVPGRSSTEVVSLTPMDKGVVSRAGRVLVVHGFAFGRPGKLGGTPPGDLQEDLQGKMEGEDRHKL